MGSPIRPQKNPVTLTWLVLMGLGFVLGWLPASGFLSLAAFAPGQSGILSIVLYAFAEQAFLGVVLGGLWLAFMLGPQEAEQGWVWALVMSVAAVLAFPLVAFGLSLFTRVPNLVGAALPLAALTMAWCAANSEAVIRLFMVFPVKGKWLAVFEVGLVFFGFGASNPVVGIGLVLPLAFFWFAGTGAIKLPRKGLADRKFEQRKDNEFRRYQEDVRRRATDREEKERLRRLFESSLEDDDEK